jgi:hypothetical protein
MGILEIVEAEGVIKLHAKIIIYGDAATEALSKLMAKEVEDCWNAPEATVSLDGKNYLLKFILEGSYAPNLIPENIFENDNPLINYFRIEEFVQGNISFVDGLGSNTGYFKLENLLNNSTTVAHEFGHTLGLDHPENIDIRGGNVPGIMYPRGTLTDPNFQYDPNVPAQTVGGTLNPAHRKVRQQDVDDLQISRLRFNNNNVAVLGNFSSIWHIKHLPDAV